MLKLSKKVLTLCCPLLLLFLVGCGYQFGNGELVDRYKTISVPYVVGDRNGDLTAELIKEIAARSPLEYRQSGSSLILHVEILEVNNDNIGYRYDRKRDGERKDWVIPSETRISYLAEVSLIDAATGRVIYEPARITSSVDFDHDYFSSSNSINIFSLGQLTDIEEAREAVVHPLNRSLAAKIVDYINNVW